VKKTDQQSQKQASSRQQQNWSNGREAGRSGEGKAVKKKKIRRSRKEL